MTWWIASSAPGATSRGRAASRSCQRRCADCNRMMEEKDDRDRLHPSPTHQLQAGGMTAVGQQHIRAKPLQNLVGQVEKRVDSCMSGERTARLEAVGKNERDADAAHGQVNDLDRRGKVGRPCHNRVPQIGKNPQESGGYVHANAGGVLTPARWQFGLGWTGRPAWPPPRRRGCADADQETGRAGCEPIPPPRRMGWLCANV